MNPKFAGGGIWNLEHKIDLILKNQMEDRSRITDLERSTKDVLSGMIWRETSHFILRQNSTVTSVFGSGPRANISSRLGVPAQSMTVLDLGGSTLSLVINGEEPISVKQGDVFDNEMIHTIEFVITGAGTTDIKLRFGYYSGPGA